ncbi:hypothetical protein GCM10027435_09950 [Haloparvum alkalitolerans]|uniref:DUF6276 family protein n=1 Tax=Haloparvum alkalitolerans TaxID=1042953 RepID=UPI003CFA33B4
MSCPDCGADRVRFAVPPALREHAPEGADAAALCPGCLRVRAVDADDAPAPDDAAFDRVADGFPTGEAGAAFALAVGKLGSLALERGSVEALLDHAEGRGADVLLALDRLAAGADPERAAFDVSRRVEQAESLLYE